MELLVDLKIKECRFFSHNAKSLTHFLAEAFLTLKTFLSVFYLALVKR